MQIWVFVMVCEWSLCMKLLVILTIWWRVRIDLKTVKLLSNQHKLRNCAALPNLTFCKACYFTGNGHAQNLTPRKRKILWQSDVNIPKNLSFRIGILSNTAAYNCTPFIFTLYKCYLCNNCFVKGTVRKMLYFFKILRTHGLFFKCFRRITFFNILLCLVLITFIHSS